MQRKINNSISMIYKSIVGFMALSLMLVPLASFASSQEANTIKETRIIKETRGDVKPETTHSLMTPNVTSQQIEEGEQQVMPVVTSHENNGEMMQTREEIQFREGEISENNGDGQIQKQLRAKGEIEQTEQKLNFSQEEMGSNNEDGQVQKQLRDRGENQVSDKATQRRSRVSNAVKEMLQVANRNEGLGQEIRIIAQAQNENQEKIEAEMKQVKNRGALKKFFFGPDYKKLNSLEGRLMNHDNKINELKELASEISDVADLEILEKQIKTMEEIGTELEKEVVAESRGFSLFGWLNKMLAK